MQAVFKNNTGYVKHVKIGFSWTTLFFGFLVPLFRGDFKNSLLMLIIASFTFGISNLIFPFIYNKMYIKKLLESGVWTSSVDSIVLLESQGFIIG